MAAGIIPRPGTAIGPCDATASCGHVDCMNNYQDATSECYRCKKPVGYDTPCFYLHGNNPTDRARVAESVWAATPLRNASGAPLVIAHEECGE